ncbi:MULTISPECIES: DUF6356 family protein [unclassified Iodidimonas]|jgi:hypothetical protein|uniref:DUF6356 family protein n=1 Tax=unclassified Iodidimonas TaxID=2626145 RepID=UPI0024826075|nr:MULTISPECIES: DUF6356 family protein [unclassified Iodidimonas]
MIQKWFLDHPQSVGEGYFAHMGTAMRFSGLLFLGAVVCFFHALLPALFTKTGSTIISRLHDKMVRNRRRIPGAASSAGTRSYKGEDSFDYVI